MQQLNSYQQGDFQILLGHLSEIKLFQSHISSKFMKVTLTSTNHYQIKDGKVVPKVFPEVPQMNYRYIPYTPINKPSQKDYFRATIDQLLKENTNLKQELEKLQQKHSNVPKQNNNKTNNDMTLIENQLKVFKQKHAAGQEELRRTKKLMLSKDIEINELKKVNQELTQKVYGLGTQLLELKKKLDKSQIESKKINKVLESFSGTIEKVSRLESALSENPELSEEFSSCSVERRNKINDGFLSDQFDDRFMTPRQKIHELKPDNNKNRSAQQKYKSYRLYSEGPVIQNAKQTAETWKQTNSYHNQSNSESQKKYKNQKLWEDADRYDDPVAGTFSPLFTRYKK